MLFGDQIILYNFDLGHFVLHKKEGKNPNKNQSNEVNSTHYVW